MGVSLEFYRLCIGLFSHRGPRPCRDKEYMMQMKPANSGHPWRLYLATFYITLCYAALIIRLVSERNDENFIQNKGVATATSSTPNPETATNIVFTWENGMGRGVWQTGMSDTPGGDIWRQVTATGVNLLRFAGDVEENPGPPKTGPMPPEQQRLESFDKKIKVSWNRPKEGEIDDYTIIISAMKYTKTFTESGTTKTITGLTPGTVYKVCITANYRGMSSTPVEKDITTKPEPPTSLKCTKADNSITVSWQPPEDPTGVIGYEVDCTSVDQSVNVDSLHRYPVWIEKDHGTSYSYEFQKLIPNTKYTITVTSVSHSRARPILSSAASETTTTDIETVKNLRVTSYDTTSILVSWTAVKGWGVGPFKRADPAIRTRIVPTDCKETDQDEPDTLKGGESTKRFKDLSPMTSYNISVSVISVSVLGGWRGTTEGTPTTISYATRPHPITSISVTEQTTTTIKVKWPAAPNILCSTNLMKSFSGWPATVNKDAMYVVQITGKDPKTVGKKLSYDFDNLDPGTRYDISVIVTHIFKDGSTVESFPCKTTAYTYPKPPEVFDVKSLNTSSITLLWRPSVGNVDEYELKISGEDTPLKRTHKTEYTFDNLKGGRPYELVVIAVSGGKKSQPFKTTHRTMVHKPKELQILNVKNQQLTITWEQADDDKDKYTASIFDTTRQDRTAKSIGDVSASASALEHRFTALVPGREYEITLTADSGGETSEPETRLIRTLPLRPVNVRTSIVATGVMVGWSEPSGDKNEYLLEISPNETDLQRRFVISSGNETSHTFTNVTLGKLYDVKISTRSKDVESAKVIRQQRMTVGRPNNVQLQPLETSIKVTWDHAKGEKDSYHITISEVRGRTCVWKEERNANEDLEITFEALVSGRLYRVEVTTESGGEFSEYVSEKARTKIRPPTEINIADNDVKEKSIRITWPEPDCDKDRYHVSIDPADGQDPTVQIQRGQPLEYSFQKLTSGRKYHLSVRTDSGGDKSDPVTTERRTTVSRIEQISVREKTENTLTITWLDVKGEKTSYIASIREMTAEKHLQRFPDIPAHPGSYSRKFTNLTSGRKYEVSVVTVSGEMESLARNMPVRTIVSPPRNVHIPQDSVTEHSMDVVWEDARGDWGEYEHLISPKEGSARYIGKESQEGAKMHRSRFDDLVAGKIYIVGSWTRNEGVMSKVILLEGKRTKVAAVEENSIAFTNVSENEVTLEWKQAVGEKDGYRVTIYPSTDEIAAVKLQSVEIKKPLSGEIKHTFRDLTPGQKYTISIATFIENDNSAEVTKTIHTKPNKPEDFRVESFAESIAVSWNSPTGVQDEYFVEITTVPEDPEWFIKATFDEKTESSSDEGVGITDESNEKGSYQSFRYTFREKGTIKARTKYTISAQTKSGENQSGGQCSHVISVEERTKPHPPRDPRLVKEGIESVTFSWAPPIDEEQKRDIHRYIVKYKGPDEEDEREHNSGFNTSAKIEHLSDNTEYNFFIISVVETTTEDGTVERVDSERCRFTFKTMSQSTKIVKKFSQKMKQVLFVVICGGAFAISLFTFLGVFVHNCVRPFDQSEVDAATVITSTNSKFPGNISPFTPTTSAESSKNGLTECFIEKAGTQFWYFVFFSAVPAICLLAILLWKLVKRIRKNIRPRATDRERLRLLTAMEESIEMSIMHFDEDTPKLQYGRKTTRQRWLDYF